MFISLYLYTATTNAISLSIQTSGYQNMLLVDPVFHSTRSSGQIISKIDKGGLAYEKLLDTFITEVLSYLSSLIGIVIGISLVNIWLGVYSFGLIFALILYSVIVRINLEKIRNQPYIKTQDMFQIILIESLSMVAHIRSMFSATNQLEKISKYSRELLIVRSTHDMSATLVGMSSRILYTICLMIIGIAGYGLMQSGQISTISLVSALYIFFSGESAVNRIGKSYDIFLASRSRIKDLFTFIQDFGKQTYPVLPQK
jgi:ABC-type bacteriocin/lantibiotic exporter with double-glycine peptidase domain